MREIKFRFIIKDQRDDTIRIEDLLLEDYGKGLPYLNEYEIVKDRLQFTGLKDKNGKEIYEGDIIKQEFDGKTWIYEIITPNTGTQNFYRICRYRDFRTDEYGQFEYGDFYLQENTGELHESKDYEVIGNIFDSPELIK